MVIYIHGKTCDWNGDDCVGSPAQRYDVLDPNGARMVLDLCAKCLLDHNHFPRPVDALSEWIAAHPYD